MRENRLYFVYYSRCTEEYVVVETIVIGDVVSKHSRGNCHESQNGSSDLWFLVNGQYHQRRQGKQLGVDANVMGVRETLKISTNELQKLYIMEKKRKIEI